MNFKRILVLVMTFAILMGTFAPALSIFAAELHDHSHETDKETIEYVSLGDSMSNGIGMDGYDTTDNPGTDNDGRNGYLEVAPGAYPAKFAAWLAGYNGTIANGQTQYEGTNGKVNLTQLATSGVRAEDILYILTHGTEKAFDPDPWTYHDMLTNPDRWGDPTGKNHEAMNNEVAKVYQDAVKNADVISYAAGNGNYGVFLVWRILNLVGLGTPDDVAWDNEHYGYYTLENALDLVGANEELKALVMDTYNEALDYCTENGLPVDLIDRLADLFAYTTASYVLASMKTIDLIVEMNPDVTLMIVPLINNGKGFKFDITANGVTKSFDAGDFLGAIYTPLNAFLAAYTTAKQEAGQFKDATFLYSELPVNENGATIQVETYAQGFRKLYAPVEVVDGQVVYPSSRYFCHDRFIGDIRGFIFPILLGSEGVEFNANDVVEYETAYAYGPAAFTAYVQANADKAQWIAQYLGIVDTVLAAMVSKGNINADELSVEGGNFDLLALLGPSIADMGANIEGNIANQLTNDPSYLYSVYQVIVDAMIRPELEAYLSELYGVPVTLTLEQTLAMLEEEADLAPYKQQAMEAATGIATLTVIPSAMEEEILEVGILNVLLCLYGRMKLAWGLSSHPTAEGHDTLAESLMLAYENEYTAKDETLKNINKVVKLIEKFYEKGYAYADAHGYTNKVVSVINRAINRIERVDLSDNRMTSAFRVKLQAELDAMVATLEELKAAVENDDAKTLGGLKATILALKDDVKTHLKNIYALCKQAGIDFINLDEVQELIRQIDILVDIIVEVMTEDVPFLLGWANEIIKAIITDVNSLADVIYGLILDRIEATTNGNYELTPDSSYVAIGNSQYGPELAEMLHLANKFSQFGVQGDYAEAIAKADLITIKVNNGEFYQFAYTQLMGTVANIIRSNGDLMGWCDNKLVGADVRAAIASYGIDLEAQTIELEWDRYLTEGQKEILDAFLAKVKEEVLANGIPESIAYDLTPEIESILDEKGLMLPGVHVSIEPLVINTADLVVYAVENLIYSYVQFMERTTNLIYDIRTIAPDATVVITHVANPLANLPMDMIYQYLPEVAEYTKVVDGVVDALNGYLYGLAFIGDNTIFVDSEDAQVIYDALNVFCKHYYDDCTDDECNVCFEKRVAPGHSYKFVYNNDATCTERGTETGTCICGHQVTRAYGKALGHDWKDATCTTAQKCNRCGQVGKAALGHKYDNNCDKDCNVCGATRITSHKFSDWKVIEPATHISEGLRERTCMYCGFTETENFKAAVEEVNIVAIIALAVGSLIVAFGGATAIILLIQKKKEK